MNDHKSSALNLSKKNIRIAKFTLDGFYNYGNLLQSYALQQMLRNYSLHVHSIWTQRYNFLPDTWWKWREYIKYVLKPRDLNVEIGWEMARQARMRDFATRYIDMRFNVDLSTIDRDYDSCVVGSDQVWNPLFDDFWQFFLDFVPKEKRLSYAASISTPDIPAQIRERYANRLKGMNTLSLREDAGAKLVERLTGRKAEVHVDPTLLLSANEWRQVSRAPSWKKEVNEGGFLLTYFLGKRPPEIDQVAHELDLQIVNLLDKKNYEHYATGVDEFLWAVDHAALVYTDSFHGSIFSILFQTPFVVCDRWKNGKGGTTEKMGSRIDTLLSYFGFEERRTNREHGYRIERPLIPPDWSKCEPVLQREWKRSDEYLRKALNV